MVFPIVAIGASAGGLEAVSELLAGLPAQNGMAYVVVQHLDPERPSVLPELLGKKTVMPVLVAHDGQTMEVNHVYVIPPNAILRVDGDLLRLTPRAKEGPNHPADILFTSLAEARGDAAIGVVLSGGDSDGSLGVQALKHSGSITFAQEPKSARFPSMPESAIDTGDVDFVLSPREIARELVRLGSHPYLRMVATERSDAPEERLAKTEEDQLRRLFRTLRTAHGVDFTHYKRSTLRRRLARRMAVRKVEELVDYVTIFQDDVAEAAALYQDFLIRVTAFFRDPESFEGLATHVLPSICEGRSPKDPIRIWVPGCATGEEVYSIAIAVVEYLGHQITQSGIQIFGTDVSEAAIEKARAGLYLENIIEEVSPDRLERFFTREGKHYRISKTLRDLCIFARQDVIRDPPFSRLDLVSCRNLLIYFDGPAQRRVMQVFHYALRPQGFLMLGPSESVGSASDLFDLVDKPHRCYRRKGTPIGVRLELGMHNTPVGIEALTDKKEPMIRTESVEREADRVLLAQYAPASVLVDESLNILQIRGETGRYLELSSGVPSLNLHRIARPELLVDISPAVQEARETGTTARRQGLCVDELTDLTLQVIPLQGSSTQRCYLIVFEEPGRRVSGRRAQAIVTTTLPESEKDRRLLQLEREIRSTRDYLQATMEEQEAVKEELKSAHEEVLSANEEFQSTNEELETAKEELRSTNEELTTNNDELRIRNRELSLMNAEIQTTREASERTRMYADAIVETMREPLIVLDVDLKILRANQAFYKTFRARPEATEGRFLMDIDAAQWNVLGLHNELQAVITRSVAITNYELRFTIIPGSAPRTLLVNARKIPGERARAELILLAVDDVTERQANAAELRDSSQRKDEFLAMLAHELRNPLSPIANAIQILRRGVPEGSAEQLYDLIERQTARLVRLVDELLDVARISRGHIELQCEQVNLPEVALRAAEASRPRIEGRQHQLTLSLPRDPVYVDGDAVRLEQVISNLLENAAKYTEPGGRIELKLTEEDGQALLCVRDNGIGLAPENLESVFQLFRQVDSSLARTGGGLGIGLTLVQRVLELHGGRIEARSAGLGHGTDFLVRLPVAPPKPASPSDSLAEARPTPHALRARRVLIVDDNVDSADSLALLVRSWGHEVAVARDGPSALKLAERFQPEHALLDIGMPGMHGYELARRLREQNGHGGLQLIAMTGYGREQDRTMARTAGFDAHLVKPADLNKLQDLLATDGERTGKTDLRIAKSPKN